MAEILENEYIRHDVEKTGKRMEMVDELERLMAKGL